VVFSDTQVCSCPTDPDAFVRLMGLSGIARAAIDRRRAPASSRQIDVAVRAEIGPPRIEPRLRQREGAGKAQADGWYVGGRSLPRYWPQRLARGSLTARPQPGECGACFRRAGFRAGGRSAWECHRGRRSGADEGRIHPVACRPVALCAGLRSGRSGAVDAWRERSPLDKRGSNCGPDRTRHIMRCDRLWSALWIPFFLWPRAAGAPKE
jgi:hypothetical protein